MNSNDTYESNGPKLTRTRIWFLRHFTTQMVNPVARLLAGRLPGVGIPKHVGNDHVLGITTLFIATLTALAACGAPLGTSPFTPSISPQVAASAPSASASGSPVQSYTSTSFKVPLTVVVDPLLKSPPNPDSPGLLSW